jgi:hypothetical protein
MVSTFSSKLKRHAVDGSWPLKTSTKKSNAKNIIDVEFAPSIAEADEILARFGYVDADLVAA